MNKTFIHRIDLNMIFFLEGCHLEVSNGKTDPEFSTHKKNKNEKVTILSKK